MALVSVVVPTYNRRALLRQSLASILAQTHRALEVIVVDNFSDYDVAAALEEFKDARLRLVQHRNGGFIGVNRNAGIRAAQGEFLAFCDDDDLWEPDKLERQLAVFDQTRYAGVGTALRYAGDVELYRRAARLAQEELDAADILAGGGAPLSSLVIANDGAFFSTEPAFQHAEDFELQLRLVLKSGKKIRILPELLTVYRIHGQNEFRDMGKLANSLHVVAHFKSQVSPEVYRQALARQHFIFGLVSLRFGLGARAHFLEAWRFGRGLGKLKALAGLAAACLPGAGGRSVMRAYYRLINRGS